MGMYKIARYPRNATLAGGTTVVLRPMANEDADALLAFFLRIPEDERYFLKDDVTSPDVIRSWAEHLDYDRALPLLAFDGERVVADAALIRHRAGYRAHQAELRLVIDPDYRRRGLGTLLLRELADIAWDAELDHLDFELITGIQDEAIEAVEAAGALKVGTLEEFAKDPHGRLHDVVFLRIPLGKWWEWSRF